MANIPYRKLKIFDKNTVSPLDFNRLVDYVQSITLNNGLGYKIHRTKCGTNLTVHPGQSGGGSCPFTVTTAPVSGDTTSLHVSVTAGTVNSLLPSNNFDTFTISTTGLYQVKVRALGDGDGKDITSCSLLVDTDPPEVQVPTPFALPSTVDILIAVILNGTVYRTIGCGSIQLTGTQEFITNPESPADPGMLNYIAYYAWAASTV